MYFILHVKLFFPLKMEWWLTLAFIENYIYGLNCEGRTLKGRSVSWLNEKKVIYKL